MDPPSYKAARKKDRELIDKLKDDDLNKEFEELNEIIEKELKERRSKVKGGLLNFAKDKSPDTTSGSDTDSEREMEDTQKFIQEETLNIIGDVISAKVGL